MDTTKVKAVVLRSEDRKEKDKLLTLFTLEHGLLKVVLKGVSNPQSKLKFAKQPFCFADFVLSRSDGIPVVTSASMIESFFDLTLDYQKYKHACDMLSLVNEKMKYGYSEPAMFLCLLKSLQSIVSSDVSEDLVMLKFYLETLNILGYKPSFEHCSNCRSQFVDGAYIGGKYTLECAICRGNNAIKIDSKTLNIIRVVSKTDFNKLASYKVSSGDAQLALSACELILNNL